MSSYNITIPGGSSKRLPVGGKYCEKDIIVTAEETGVELPELTNPGTDADLLAGKELIDADGNIVTGTATYSTLYIKLAKPNDNFGDDGDVCILAIGG